VLNEGTKRELKPVWVAQAFFCPKEETATLTELLGIAEVQYLLKNPSLLHEYLSYVRPDVSTESLSPEEVVVCAVEAVGGTEAFLTWIQSWICYEMPEKEKR